MKEPKMRLPVLLLVPAASLLLFPVASRATDPATTGEIDAEFETRKQEISKADQGRTDAQMSPPERRERQEKERAALREILSKRGVTEKEYARSQTTENRERKAEAEQSKKAWKEKREAEQKKAAEVQGETKPTEVPVQRGFNEKNPPPVREGEGPPVETGVDKDSAGVAAPRSSGGRHRKSSRAP
jgi:DNA polymerase III gamma/tau subunit